ncbi:MAG TPA: isochorismatase family cysteine hydrolase [Candidatus Acidoferrales bacterium]
MAAKEPKPVFWDVDTQADFMLAGGRLYVPHAETIIPNLKRLVEFARAQKLLIVSSADAHQTNDEEFQQWPPHCLVGTPGQQKIPETVAERRFVIPNLPGSALPFTFDGYEQIVLEKQKLDVFTNPNIETVLSLLGKRPVTLFGVVTEYCVACAARGLLERGYPVHIVTDAMKTLNEPAGRATIESLVASGATLTDTNSVLKDAAYRAERA